MGSILRMDNAASEFLNTLDSVISEKLKRVDDTILCRIRQVNDDGTVNVVVEPDESNVVTGVGNILMGELKEEDYVWVYRIGQNFTNSFVIYKLGYNVDVNNFKNTIQSVTYSGGGGSQSNITIVTGDANGQIKVINGTYSYNVNVKGLAANAYTDTPIPTVYLENATYANNVLTITSHSGTTITIPIPEGGNFVTVDTDQTITGQKTFTQPIVSKSGTPMVFDYSGSGGTYNKGAFVCNGTDGIGLEAPFTEDSPSSERLPITFSWRGGSQNMGGMKIDDSGAYEKIGSGAWQKIDVCNTYNFTNTFSDIWTINHNMNKFPQVTIVRVYIDSSTQEIVKTEEIIAAVEYTDLNNLTVRFESEIKGYAYLS